MDWLKREPQFDFQHEGHEESEDHEDTETLSSSSSFVSDNSMDAIRFTFTPTQREYIIATRAFLLRQPLYLLIVFGLGLISSVIWLLFSMNASSADTIVLGLPAIIAPFGLPVLFLIMAPIAVASSTAKSQTLAGELRWEASAAGLRVAGANTDTLLNWGLFKDVIETRRFFLLVFHQRRKLFQMIPKRAFASADDENRFRVMARQAIGE